MKKIFILLIICFCASMAKAETFFEECENIPGVTTVYVSKAMISLAGDLNIDSDNMDFNSIASKIDGLWVVNAETTKPESSKTKPRICSTVKTTRNSCPYVKTTKPSTFSCAPSARARMNA